MIQTLILALLAYLLGAVSFARLIAAAVLPGEDISRTTLVLPGENDATLTYTGVSATSLGARLGPRWGMLTGVLDMLKGFVPVLACRLIWPESTDHLVVALMIVIGHNWPVYYRFKGGRGQSSMIGSLLAINPLAPLISYPLGAALGLLVMRDMFIAYGLGQILLIVWFALFGTGPEVLYAVAINAAYVVASLPEILEYWDRRARGEVIQIKSWRELLKAHPAMGSNRYKTKTDD